VGAAGWCISAPSATKPGQMAAKTRTKSGSRPVSAVINARYQEHMGLCLRLPTRTAQAAAWQLAVAVAVWQWPVIKDVLVASGL
jgi:hypothetical protein